ncbi:MAG: DegV family protein [Actinobacteria bacterium]|nr:DegV family protein [Actinomycetota bacterium]
MAKIGIVTDSTADMPADFYESNEIKVVPLYVRFGEEEIYRDWEDIGPGEFYARMRTATELPKTSQPSVEDFTRAYEEFEGCDGVISLHLSGKLSGTIQSAQIAAENAPVPVYVIDGEQASAATGLILQGLVKARDEGQGIDRVKQIAERLAKETKILFCVESLKYLEMGGRIGRAKYLAASLLKIKPILTLVDGEVAPFKTVKSRTKALDEIAGFSKSYADGRPVHVCYAHADNSEIIPTLRDTLRGTGVELASEVEAEIGCVIGAYIGPGAFALVLRAEISN